MIIVTGGAGFIGCNLIDGLNTRGIDQIWVVDNLVKSEKVRNLAKVKIADYIDKNDAMTALSNLKNRDIQAIFHQGACSDTMEADGRYMMQNNYEFSKRLLQFALEKQIPFIYASSASVYGNGDAGFREDLACESPLNVYAYSKFLFDQYVRQILPNATSQIAGLRYFNVYGPHENHKGAMASVVFHFSNQARQTGEIRVFEGSENFRRDFIDVEDVVKINLHLYDNPQKKGIFNCGTGNAESFMKIAEIVKNRMPGSKIVNMPFPEKLKGKYQAFTQADICHLRQSAGYQAAFTPLESGVARYCDLLLA